MQSHHLHDNPVALSDVSLFSGFCHQILDRTKFKQTKKASYQIALRISEKLRAISNTRFATFAENENRVAFK